MSKWNYESCYNEAKKYKYKVEFERNASRAYMVARKNGWDSEYVWFVSPPKYNQKWDHDACYNEAKKYTYQTEFKKGSPGAYNSANKHKWLKDYTWFKRPAPPNKKWTYETCYNEAKKYKHKIDFFKNCKGGYQAAIKNGWYDDYTWFEPMVKPVGYWNEQTCYEEALKYRTLRDFRINAVTAYSVSCKKGWISSYDWFVKPDAPVINCYIVYSYQHVENKTVYVGLTCDPRTRHRQHAHGTTAHGTTTYSAVYQYFNSIGLDVPNPIVLKKGLYANEAQYWENYYVNYFKNEGWNVLNKAKPGALGTFSTFWTYESCYKEAKKYKTKTDFRYKSYSAFMKSVNRGWYDDYTWLIPKQKPTSYWTYERCYEEAKKYPTKQAFRECAPGARCAASKNGWMKDYTWFKRPAPPNKKWVYETCYEEAKKYTSTADFYKFSNTAYRRARENGWLNDYTWLNKFK